MCRLPIASRRSISGNINSTMDKKKVTNITCLQVGEVLRVQIARCEDMEDN
jgi:hypothetical protein